MQGSEKINSCDISVSVLDLVHPLLPVVVDLVQLFELRDLHSQFHLNVLSNQLQRRPNEIFLEENQTMKNWESGSKYTKLVLQNILISGGK